MIENQTKRRARAIARWVGTILLVVTIAALVGSTAYQRQLLRARDLRLVELEQRVAALATDQSLLAAIVAANTTSSTPEPSVQGTVTEEAPPSAPGTRRIFGRIVSAARAPYGWDLQVDPSQYMTGTPAFSLASSRGELTNSDGSYILDTSDRKTQMKLVKDAKVTVASWPGAPKGAAASISAEELVAVLPGGETANPKWAKAWFWLDVRDGYVLQVTQQRVE